MSKVIGIVSSRRHDGTEDFQACRTAFLEVYRRGDTIVSGGCSNGGDRFAEKIAKQCGITITIFYPDWELLGKNAGFYRNSFIAEACDILIAVVARDRKGETEDTISKAKQLNKKVIIVG